MSAGLFELSIWIIDEIIEMPQQHGGGVVLRDNSEGSLLLLSILESCCQETWTWHKLSLGT